MSNLKYNPHLQFSVLLDNLSAREAVAWMRIQAKAIAPDIVNEKESVAMCARIISGRIDQLEDFVKTLAADNQGSIFLIQKAKQLISQRLS